MSTCSIPEVGSKFISLDIDNVTVRVPLILVEMFDQVEKNLVQGTFRVSGSIRRVKFYMNSLKDYQSWLPNVATHDLCGIIKKILKQYNTVLNTNSVEELKVAYEKYEKGINRRQSNVSWESSKSSPSLYMNSSDLDSDVASRSTYRTCRSTIGNDATLQLLDQISDILNKKNPSYRNDIFLFLLDRLSRLSLHEAITKMSSDNLSIIFQPYIMEDVNISNINTFHQFLKLLIDNKTAFLNIYNSKADTISETTGSDSNSLDSISVNSREEGTTFSRSRMPSDARTNSAHDISPRRISISSRFNSFWDSYTSPVGKGSRFSFDFSKSKESLNKSRDHINKANCNEDNYPSSEKAKDPLYPLEANLSIKGASFNEMSESIPHLIPENDLNSIVSCESESSIPNNGFKMNKSQELFNVKLNPNHKEKYEISQKHPGKDLMENRKKSNRKSLLSLFRSNSELSKYESRNASGSFDQSQVERKGSIFGNKRNSLLKSSLSLKLKTKKI